MDRIGGMMSPPGTGLTRVTDLERSQQWTSLTSDINDLEVSRMRARGEDVDPRKRMLHRRSMPEPQQTSMIYVDVDTEDYEKYFHQIGSDSLDESVDSWSWRPDSAGNSASEKNGYLYTDNNANNNNNNNNNYESYGSRGEGNKGRRKKETEEVEAYRGSREKLHEIFRRNRDLRRQFFADVQSPELKREATEAGNGYGSVETLTSQSNHSETGSGNAELAAVAARKNSRNLKYATLVDQTASLREFGGSARDRKEKLHFSLPRRGTRRYEALSFDAKTPSGNRSPDIDGNQSPPPPPLPATEPPATSISADESLISADFTVIRESNVQSPKSKNAQRSSLINDRQFDADRRSTIYKPDSEGLKMLDRFEACIEQRKQPSVFSRSRTAYKSLPNLAHTGSDRRSGIISRLAINGSTIDLDFTDTRRVPREALKRGREPEEIRATRVDLENLRLGDRRRGIPPPLDLSGVSEAMRRDDLRWERRVLRDYSFEDTPLKDNKEEPIKCTVTVVQGAEVQKPRPSAGQATLETATNLVVYSRNDASSAPSVPVRAAKVTKDEEVSPTSSSGVPNRFKSSVVVWCDGKNAAKDTGNRDTERMVTKRTNLEQRKSTGSLIPVTGNVFPSVYAPIPYKSPRRYVEGEVTIHYRSPVRTEAKEVLSEAELARRSAENMRRVYQEERRRKYLQELHDIDSRRHTDNFTPSQKSPIPLNRYDDFVDDLSQRSRSQEQTPEPRLVAKALYNFVGQSSRELTFRRGDIIFVRRQVDKNWYEGEHNAMIGLFPFNYVEILPYDGIRTTTTPKKPYEGQARAKFNFVAQTTHELSLLKGDLVVLTRRVDENWYEGRIGNRKGIFPISYVEVLVEPGIRSETPAQNKPVAAPAAHSLLSNGSAGGKLSMGPHHYTPSIPTNTNASQSHYNSLPRVGGSKLHVAPVNETLHIDTHSEPLRYRALYNYRPQNDDELELKEGDTVYVMEKCDDGWFVGSSQRTGCFGTFPGNYVERL